MMNQKTIIFIFILAALAGLLLGLRLFLIKKEIPLQVTFVSPENLATDVSVSAQIKIDFNRPLQTDSEVVVALSPQITLTKTLENNGRTLILSPQGPFSSGIEYGLIVNDNQNHPLWQLKFTTQKLQGDPRIPYEGEQSTKSNYPLLSFTPYVTEDFFITYTAPLTLGVTIKKGDPQAIGPLVLEWIGSHGVDPATHKIDFLTPGL